MRTVPILRLFHHLQNSLVGPRINYMFLLQNAPSALMGIRRLQVIEDFHGFWSATHPSLSDKWE